MHIKDLRQIHNNYDHIYLSPHLDDAALSCGGVIARHSAMGVRVLVVTVCTALAQAPFSPFVEELHSRWGLDAASAVSARLREDDLAMERLGADYYQVGMLDAIYRLPQVYTSNEALFGVPVPDDPLLPAMRQLISALRDRTPRAMFYAPLGVGNHVDHQITYIAAQESTDIAIAFYEDFPYVGVPGALEQRLVALGKPFVPSTIDIDATLARKIGAIDVYASQVGELFGSSAAMAQMVTAYAEVLRPDVGTYGERIWLRYVPPQ